MVKPVKNLHGLSPVEDWIQHSQYVEQQRDALTKRIERLREKLKCVRLYTYEHGCDRTKDLCAACTAHTLADEALDDDDKENL